MRIVIDTNILVRAAKRATGPARELLGAIKSGPHCLVASGYLLAEVERVLHYPRVRRDHGLSENEMREFVTALHEAADVVDLEAESMAAAISTDPDDDPIIRTAVQGNAQVICTRDRHLRSRKVRAYCARHGIQVMSEVELLRVLRS